MYSGSEYLIGKEFDEFIHIEEISLETEKQETSCKSHNLLFNYSQCNQGETTEILRRTHLVCFFPTGNQLTPGLVSSL